MNLKLKSYSMLILKFLTLNVLLFLFSTLAAFIFNIVVNFLVNDYIISTLKILFESVGIISSIYIYGIIFNRKIITNGLKQKINKSILVKFIYGSLIIAVVIPIIMLAFNSLYFDSFIWNKLYSEDILALMCVGFIECFFEVFSEEILYRYSIINILEKDLNYKLVIFLSTVYYLVIHSFDSSIGIIGFINLALINIILSLIYIKFKNIWYCIIPRTIFEFITAYLFSLNRMGRDEIGILFLSRTKDSIVNGSIYGTYGSIITLIILIIISITYFIYNNRVKTK